MDSEQAQGLSSWGTRMLVLAMRKLKEGSDVRRRPNYEAEWCICDEFWKPYHRTDPQCRHEETEELHERIERLERSGTVVAIAQLEEQAARLEELCGSAHTLLVHMGSKSTATPSDVEAVMLWRERFALLTGG